MGPRCQLGIWEPRLYGIAMANREGKVDRRVAIAEHAADDPQGFEGNHWADLGRNRRANAIERGSHGCQPSAVGADDDQNRIRQLEQQAAQRVPCLVGIGREDGPLDQ